MQEDCYLAKVPSDTVIMRAGDPQIRVVRDRLVEASVRPEFHSAFGTGSNLNGALFSHGTARLQSVEDSARDYLGGLDSQLKSFTGVFDDPTTPQNDIKDSQFVRCAARA